MFSENSCFVSSLGFYLAISNLPLQLTAQAVLTNKTNLTKFCLEIELGHIFVEKTHQEFGLVLKSLDPPQDEGEETEGNLFE